MGKTLYTIGYEGQDIETFVQRLQDHGIEMLIDVRELPLSRKRGFSKKALGEALAAGGIGYEHWKALGCPKSTRQQYRATGDRQEYTRQFLEYLDTQCDALTQLLARAEQTTCALMCFEADASQCHRSYVAQKLSDLSGQRVAVHNLSGPR